MVRLGRLAAMRAEPILIQRIHVYRGPDSMDSPEIFKNISSSNNALDEEQYKLFPRSRPVGENTESTADAGGVQPGGGSFLAAAHADTKV